MNVIFPFIPGTCNRGELSPFKQVESSANPPGGLVVFLKLHESSEPQGARYTYNHLYWYCRKSTDSKAVTPTVGAQAVRHCRLLVKFDRGMSMGWVAGCNVRHGVHTGFPRFPVSGQVSVICSVHMVSERIDPQRLHPWEPRASSLCLLKPLAIARAKALAEQPAEGEKVPKRWRWPHSIHAWLPAVTAALINLGLFA